MAQIKITFIDRGVQARLQGLARRSADLSPAFASAGEHLLRATRQRFDTELDPDGAKWAPLKPATVKAKARARSGKRGGKSRARGAAPATAILQDTWGLRDTLTYEVMPRGLRIGTPMRRGVYHQFGTARVAQRKFLGLSAVDGAIIEEIVRDFLDG